MSQDSARVKPWGRLFLMFGVTSPNCGQAASRSESQMDSAGCNTLRKGRRKQGVGDELERLIGV